ncbi:MAG: hypothetical protein JW875_00605 [Spirochaetales bacterium]|nr:hypothetical protein [Spirochaetales bacterium]
MTPSQWAALCQFRDAFRQQCEQWLIQGGGTAGWLAMLQQEAAQANGTPNYSIETPVVYNRNLDCICQEDDIRLILVGDNPGKEEQKNANQRYLVGQAGRLADGFFSRNSELSIHFRKQVLILNKSPIHSAKTKELAYIQRMGGPAFEHLFQESQIWMARETAALQHALGCSLWIVGYGELRPKGLFSGYAATLSDCYPNKGAEGPGKDLRLFQHFSMNRFTIDLSASRKEGESLLQSLDRTGIKHRKEILSW